MSIRKIYILILFPLGNSCLNAQNLVPNPSFEEYKTCPSHFNFEGNSIYPNSWSSATSATPDYFNKCCRNKNSVGVPKNMNGVQDARTGIGYMGFFVYDLGGINAGRGDYREYIQVKLNDSLKKDEMYCVKFYVSLADSSNYETSCIGSVLSKEAITLKKANNSTYQLGVPQPILLFIPQIKNDSGNFISNDTDWVEISGIYKAAGGEQYITIGDFNRTKQNIIQKRKNIIRTEAQPGSTIAYYYVDDVSVTPIATEFDYLSESKPIPLNNISFNTGKSILLPTSFPELDKLVTSLKQNSNSKIEVSGHTDISGNENENLKLSEARAKAVVDYLILKGIKKDRLKFKGYGSSKPIAKNDTEEGKQQNRRVEIEFLK